MSSHRASAHESRGKTTVTDKFWAVGNKISFTGSPEVGRAIQVAAAETVKRVTLELGGTSPQVGIDPLFG